VDDVGGTGRCVRGVADGFDWTNGARAGRREKKVIAEVACSRELRRRRFVGKRARKIETANAAACPPNDDAVVSRGAVQFSVVRRAARAQKTVEFLRRQR